jgi:hypothetical protein
MVAVDVEAPIVLETSGMNDSAIKEFRENGLALKGLGRSLNFGFFPRNKAFPPPRSRV